MATSPRSLRIGVVIGGTLVEERVFDGATPITFGQSLRCALSVPVDGVPREHVLFTREADGFVLHETARMEVQRADGRGRVTIGDASILSRRSRRRRVHRRCASIAAASDTLMHGAVVAFFFFDVP